MRIIVQSIKPPAAGKKCSVIVTTDRAKLYIFPHQVAMFHEGVTYDVETENFGDSGTMTKITKATRVPDMPPPAASAAPREPFVSGAYRPPANSPLATPPDLSPASKEEAIFVQGIVQHFIDSGEVSLDTVEEAIKKIRGVWKRTLGRATLQRHMEAAE